MTKLNDQISKMESETSKRTRELEELKNTLGYDFGAQKEFMPLSEECFTIRQKQYTYEFCPFKSMYQKEGSGSTSLGRFEGWKQNSDELIMEFRNGQRCWNGPARSADVAMICGSKNELISADEPSTCVYTFSFRTPAACDEVSLERLVASIPQGF